MGFSRQKYWSALPCPPPGDLLEPGIEPASLMSPALAGRFFTTNTTWITYGAYPNCERRTQFIWTFLIPSVARKLYELVSLNLFLLGWGSQERFHTPPFTLTGGLGANDCVTVFVFIFVLTTSTVGGQVWEWLASIILELQPKLRCNIFFLKFIHF